MRIISAENQSAGFADYFTGRSRVSSQLWPAGRKEGEHIHLLTQASTVVLAGEVEVMTQGEWTKLAPSSGAVFEAREPHDVRARADAPTFDLPGIAKSIAALTLTEMIVPPSLDIFEEEIDLVVREDRFDVGYLSDPKNTAHWSTGLRTDGAKSQHFWEILARNRNKLDSLHRALNV